MFKKLDLKTTYSPKKTSTISLRKGSHNLVQTQTPAIPSLQKNSYFLKQNFNKPTQLSLKGKKREIYPGQSINLSLPTTK